MLEQRQHLLNYFKTLSVGSAGNRTRASRTEDWRLTNWANQVAVIHYYYNYDDGHDNDDRDDDDDGQDNDSHDDDGDHDKDDNDDGDDDDDHNDDDDGHVGHDDGDYSDDENIKIILIVVKNIGKNDGRLT